MKKITILLLIAILTLAALTACSAKAHEDNKTVEKNETISYTHTDKSIPVTMIPYTKEAVEKIQQGRFLFTDNVDEYWFTDNCVYLIYNIRNESTYPSIVIASYKLPEDSVFCGVSHVGILYREDNTAHIIGWDFRNIHSFTGVQFVICSEYYLMEDNVAAPLFHMTDGSIKAYNIFTNDLIDPIREGVATLNPSNSGSTVKKSN